MAYSSSLDSDRPTSFWDHYFSGIPLSRAKSVKEKYETAILSKRSVVGLGVGFRQKAGQYTDEVAIIIHVEKKIPAYN